MENDLDLAERVDDIERTCITWIDRATQLELTITKLAWQLADAEKRIEQLKTFQQAQVARIDRLSVAAGIA